MTLEAVEFYRFVTMATHAKTVLARSYTIVLRAGVAFDATLQAVLRLTHALANCFIPLMIEQLRVILSHPLRVLHALPTLADIELGPGRSPGKGGRGAKAKQQGREPLHHSPNPIWM